MPQVGIYSPPQRDYSRLTSPKTNLKNIHIMEQNITETTCYCGRCHRELPVGAFYMRRDTEHPDCYCIACRKEMNRTRYRESHIENAKRDYPVITDIADDTQRLSLIRHALRVIRENAARKRMKLRATDYMFDL